MNGVFTNSTAEMRLPHYICNRLITAGKLHAEQLWSWIPRHTQHAAFTHKTAGGSSYQLKTVSLKHRAAPPVSLSYTHRQTALSINICKPVHAMHINWVAWHVRSECHTLLLLVPPPCRS
jgi:hypothetical protein